MENNPVYKAGNKGAYVGVATDGQPNDFTVASSPFHEVSKMRSNMGIIRRKKSDNYSVIYNECFQNDSLSARAKGIFAYLMTLPDDWKIYKRELSKHFREGRDALNTAFDELESAGYITKTPERGADGKLDGWDYTVYESTELLKTRNTENPKDGEPATTKYLQEQSTKTTNTEDKPPANEKDFSNKKQKTPEQERSLALARAAAEKIAASVLSINPTSTNLSDAKRESTLTSWAQEIERLHRIDKKPWGDINRVLAWAITDSFWKTNILSGGKFRKQYDALYVKVQSATGNQRGPEVVVFTI